jgi:hypothetical protein
MAVMYKENEWKEILCTRMISVKVQETVKINFSPTTMSLKLLTPTYYTLPAGKPLFWQLMGNLRTKE